VRRGPAREKGGEEKKGHKRLVSDQREEKEFRNPHFYAVEDPENQRMYEPGAWGKKKKNQKGTQKTAKTGVLGDGVQKRMQTTREKLKKKG